MVEEDLRSKIIQHEYALIIIVEEAVENAISLTAHLRQQFPEARIVIASSSPTWKRSRNAFRAGAMDYLPISQGVEEIRSQIKAVLEMPLPSTP